MNATPTSLPALLGPVNELLTPAFRAGWANPLPGTAGFVVLEVPGRVSGRLRMVPLLCTDVGGALVVSTVRRRSQWLRNLAAADEVRVWLRGSERLARPAVYRGGRRVSGISPELAWGFLGGALSTTVAGVAVLTILPARSGSHRAFPRAA